jgi:hypothetical protein
MHRPPAGAVSARRARVNLYTSKYPLDEFQRALDDAGRVRGRGDLLSCTASQSTGTKGI